MSMLSMPRRGSLGVALVLGLLLAGCASGEGEDGGPDFDAGPRRDAGPGSDDAGVDAGMGMDGGSPCGDVTCDPFQYCDNGMCRDYPACRGDGTCDRPGDVCHNRRCVPGDVDVDGDGSPASEDCDETNAEIYPGQMEECNGIDDNCNMMADEGDPAAICESYPGGGICIDGNCGCPAGSFDLDRTIAGCECMAMPAIDAGLSCMDAIDLGNVSDSGQMMTITGNVMPDDREVWYTFNAVDEADTSCDNFHLRVLMTTNPDDTFEFTVFRGACDGVECDDSGFTDYTRATDFRQDIMGTLTGQCPCTAAGAARMADVSTCQDDGGQYFVRVRRRQGSMLNCEQYTIEISNGIYDTP